MPEAGRYTCTCINRFFYFYLHRDPLNVVHKTESKFKMVKEKLIYGSKMRFIVHCLSSYLLTL